MEFLLILNMIPENVQMMQINLSPDEAQKARACHGVGIMTSGFLRWTGIWKSSRIRKVKLSSIPV
jgi:hypothetical protein